MQRDTSARSAGLGTGHVYGELTVDLADDRVLGAHGLRDGGDRGGDGPPTSTVVNGSAAARGQAARGTNSSAVASEKTLLQSRIGGRQRLAAPPLHQVAEGRPVG